MAHWSWGASFPGEGASSEGASGASSDSEEESSSLSSASSPESLPEAVRQAAEDGIDIETVNAWLRTEPDINAQDEYGRPLIYSAVRGTINAPKVDLARRLLALRCLATKGRAKTTDPVMNFLVQLGDNGVIWKVLSFWPPPP